MFDETAECARRELASLLAIVTAVNASVHTY